MATWLGSLLVAVKPVGAAGTLGWLVKASTGIAAGTPPLLGVIHSMKMLAPPPPSLWMATKSCVSPAVAMVMVFLTGMGTQSAGAPWPPGWLDTCWLPIQM